MELKFIENSLYLTLPIVHTISLLFTLFQFLLIINIFSLPLPTSLERVFMVQTEQQYVCIHQCLLAVLEGKEHLLADSHELHENDGYEGE